MPSRSDAIAYGLLTLTALFWGGNFVVGRAVSADIPPIALAWWRWCFALGLILPFCLVPLWRKRRQLWQARWPLLLLAALGVTAFNTLVYLGLQTATASDALLILSAGPILILLISWVLYREKISTGQLLGVSLSLLGVLMIISRGAPWRLLSQLEGNLGLIWILLAVISWAFYSVLLRLRPRGLTGFEFFASSVILGFLLLTPFYLYEHWVQARILIWNEQSLYALFYVSIFASVLAFLFWNQGVAQLGANRTGYFIHLIPVWGILLAYLFLAERLYLFHALGIGMIVAGLILSTGRAVTVKN